MILLATVDLDKENSFHFQYRYLGNKCERLFVSFGTTSPNRILNSHVDSDASSNDAFHYL